MWWGGIVGTLIITTICNNYNTSNKNNSHSYNSSSNKNMVPLKGSFNGFYKYTLLIGFLQGFRYGFYKGYYRADTI